MDLTNQQRNRIKPLLTSLKKTVAAVYHAIRERSFQASSRYCAKAFPVRTWAIGTRLTKLAIHDSGNGSSNAFSKALSKCWSKTSIKPALFKFAKHSPTAPWHWQKRDSAVGYITRRKSIKNITIS